MVALPCAVGSATITRGNLANACGQAGACETKPEERYELVCWSRSPDKERSRRAWSGWQRPFEPGDCHNLSISEGTVKCHLHRVYEKLQVRNRMQATHKAREHGDLSPMVHSSART